MTTPDSKGSDQFHFYLAFKDFFRWLGGGLEVGVEVGDRPPCADGDHLTVCDCRTREEGFLGT